MKLLANENFPLSSVKILENNGYDVLFIGRDHSGYLDSEIMEISIKEERTILTFDRDYGELIFKEGFKPSKGVIYIRWHHYFPDEPALYLLKLFKKESYNFDNKLTVIDKDKIRQRKY